VGSAVPQDSAVLSGGYHESGAITFTLTAPDGSVVDTEQVTPSGDGIYTTSNANLATQVGTYTWTAAYAGDNLNNPRNDQGGPAEQVTTIKASPTLNTTAGFTAGNVVRSAIPQDSAVLSGGYHESGAITFTLTAPDGSVVDTEQLTPNGDGIYTTSNANVATQVGTYTWTAAYAGDNLNNPRNDQGGPAEQVTTIKGSPTLVTTASPATVTLGATSAPTLSDSAVLAGGNLPDGLPGSITFTLTGPGGFFYTQTDTVAGDGTYNAATTLPATGVVAGTYTWSARYSGDAANNGAKDQGGSAEQTVLTITPLRVLAVGPVLPNPRNNAVSSVFVTFNEPINTSSLTPGAISLTDNGNPVAITAAVTIAPGPGSQYTINGLGGLTTAQGLYTLTVNAAGIKNTNGNAGTNAMSTSWLMDTTPPKSHVVNSLAMTQSADSFPVSVIYSDPTGPGGSPASGVSSVDLYDSVDNGPFRLYQTQSFAPTASGSVIFTFVGQDRNLYAFHSIAHDAAGNTEAKNNTAIEASTSVPDLHPPVTHVLASNPSYSWNPFPASEFGGLAPSSYSNGVFTLNWAGADPDANTGVPPGSIALVNIYVQVDGGAAVLIGQPLAGAPNGSGVYSGSITYSALGDGLPHTYSFYSVGVDDQQLKQYAPQAGPGAPDLTFSNTTYTAPLGIQNLVVEKNIAERSFIQYLDVDFNQSLATSPALQTLKSGLAGGSRSSYLELLWYGENLTASSTPQGSVNLFNAGTTASVSLTGNDLSINFGPNGVTNLLTETGVKGTGSPTSSFGDGWYALGIDPTGNPSNGQVFWVPFFRLLGSATGDLTVSGPFTTAGTDAYVVYHAEGESGPLLNGDVNGDGTVNSKDLTETVAANGHSVGATPPEKFPQFQLFAGPAGRPVAVTAPVTQKQIQALLPEAIAAWQVAGLDPAGVRRLEGVQIQVGNLGTGILGLQAGGVITINQTAAGNNWYVNASAGSNRAIGLVGPGGEEVAGPGSPAVREVDLLTVLEHELGHVIGLSDNAQAGDLMDITLGLGVRRAPSARDLAPIHEGASVAATVLPAAVIAPVRIGDRAFGGEKRNEFRTTATRRSQPVLVNGSVSVSSVTVDAALGSISIAAAGKDEAQGLNVDGASPTRSVVRISAIAAKPGRREQGAQSAFASRRLPSSFFPQVIRRQGVAAGAFIKPSARE